MSDDRVMLAWNFPNWITVILMALAGYAIVLGLASALGMATKPPAGG